MQRRHRVAQIPRRTHQHGVATERLGGLAMRTAWPSRLIEIRAPASHKTTAPRAAQVLDDRRSARGWNLDAPQRVAGRERCRLADRAPESVGLGFASR